jgi:hypothetical protein
MREALPNHRSDEPRLVSLPATLGSFGAAIHFLAAEKTFGRKPLGEIVLEVSRQLHSKWNICAVRGQTLIGYCGWVFTTREIAEKYIAGEPIPDSDVSPDEADTPVLTIVRILEPQLVLPLMRACRNRYPGRRVFFRREYLDRDKQKRSSSVLNATGSRNLRTADQEAPLTITISPS